MGDELKKHWFIILFAIPVAYLTIFRQEEYELIEARGDDVHIVRNEEVVVGSTIIEKVEVEGFVAGLRMPVVFLTCTKESGYVSYRNRIQNIRHFFILDKKKHKVMFFDSEDIFKNSLKNLGIYSKVDLNMSRFETIWDKYSKVYERDKFDRNKCQETSLNREQLKTK